MGDSMKIKNLSKNYDDKIGIKDINLDLNRNCVYAVLGHNGSGKSTLFRTVLGLIPGDGGKIDFQDIDSIGYVPEYRALYQNMQVEDHILFLARLRKMKKETAHENMNKLIQMFQLEHYRKTKIQTLSKGNQQKVQFICALIHDPDLILLDEPMTGLDIVNVNLFKEIIHQMIQEGKKIIMSSHQYDELEEFCEYILILKEGHDVLQGSVEAIKRKHPYEYLSITYDKHKRYQGHKDVLSVETTGHLSRYKIKKNSSLIETVIENRDISTVKLESISLKDLVNTYYG